MAERRDLHELDDDQLLAAVRASHRRDAGAEPDWDAMRRSIGDGLDAVDARRQRGWLGRFWYVPALASATAALLIVLALRAPGVPTAEPPRVATVADPAVPDAGVELDIPGEDEVMLALAEPAIDELGDRELDALDPGDALAVDEDIDALFAELEREDSDDWDLWLPYDADYALDLDDLDDLSDAELDLLADRISS